MYTIKLADGTELKTINLNGDTFESSVPIEDSVFEGNLSRVEVTNVDTGEAVVLTNARLLLNRAFGDVWWFVIQEPPEKDKAMEQITSDVTDIQIALAELYEMLIG